MLKPINYLEYTMENKIFYSDEKIDFSYEEFVEEFSNNYYFYELNYNREKLIILSNGPESSYFCIEGLDNIEKSEYYKNAKDLLENATIYGRHLKDIWDKMYYS